MSCKKCNEISPLHWLCQKAKKIIPTQSYYFSNIPEWCPKGDKTSGGKMSRILIALWVAVMAMGGTLCVLYEFKLGNNEVGIVVLVVALWSMEVGRMTKDWENNHHESTKDSEGCG